MKDRIIFKTVMLLFVSCIMRAEANNGSIVQTEGQLNNSLTLISASGDILFRITYSDKNPWPESPDGLGYSLVNTNPDGDMNDPLNWRASNSLGGSPGKEDVVTFADNDMDEHIEKFDLSQNYPNPFNPETRISYSLKKSGRVRISGYNIIGREVDVLVNADQVKGNYNVTFSSNNLSSGVYFYRLQSTEGVITKKMVLLR